MENIKITLLGNSGVGKTCIIRRYSDSIFDENSVATQLANYSQKVVEIDNHTLQVDLWDTAGQEKYRSLGRNFYKDSFIVCLVYDITSHDSFIDLKEIWYSDLKEYGEKYTVLAVVGNKSDCYEEEQVKEEEAKEFAEKIDAIFMLTSAKTGSNINFLFEKLLRQYLGPKFACKLDEISKDKGEVVNINKNANNKKKKKCC